MYVRRDYLVDAFFSQTSADAGLTACVSELSVQTRYSECMKHVLIILICTLVSPALASGDHNDAHEAVRRQQVIPLADIIPGILAEFDARLLEAEFEREHGIYVYELELITGSGRMIEVMVDAATGEILEVEQEGRYEGDN